eukprot:5775196-Pleurochrysis_carterae.AAC.1
MKPAAAYFVGQFTSPANPHCKGAAHVWRQSAGCAHASSKYILNAAATPDEPYQFCISTSAVGMATDFKRASSGTSMVAGARARAQLGEFIRNPIGSGSLGV